MMNMNERADAMAALLREDYGHFSTVIEKSHNLNRAAKVRILSAVLSSQNGTKLDVDEILRLINGSPAG